MEHRPLTTSLHRTRSCAILSTSDQLRPAVFISVSTVLFHVFRGLPLCRCPCGVHLRACLAMQPWPLRMVCPIHVHFLPRIVSSAEFCPALAQSSSFVTLSCQLIPSILRNRLLMKTCTFFDRALVVLHVSDPYRSTDFTLELNILTFVCL